MTPSGHPVSLVCPGQGSQTPGMGKALADAYPAARAVFDEVDEALGQNLSKLMFEGPADELTLTANAQPALMAHAVAAYRALESEGFSVGLLQSAAGHSLGEYAAYCIVGTFTLSETARLLRVRGEAMQAAVPAGEGGMAAILGLTLEQVEEAVSGTEAEVANDNAPGQVVISGRTDAVAAACEKAKAMGAKRALPLPVSAPFHSSLMQPAAEAMAEALSAVDIRDPRVPVFANVTAAPVPDDEISATLIRQVTGRVRWTETIQAMIADGTGLFVEVGTGKVLSGLIKRIEKGAKTVSFGEPSDIEAFRDALSH
ncbi:ACP S-malonyltransferase [Parvularcula dongshanensis]|uniref:Malonyl CoA-acyl carrier protein transacylase n=1 Tax=Parvularcula dongshanensis TaxID=1173995 RepID=A0A840I5A0_9PROT|nr:ACP S-malonyltransferase [Parvularcula dongshanensis]MBB4660136.1 [acyl-carrier-protein] S-malonyltransferase [Parvularcula dongshanensis]